MRYAILSALVFLAGTAPAPGGWGASCAPAVAGPRFYAPAMPQFAPIPPAHHGFPVFVAGPGGICSARCVCGCNEGKPCECNGPVAKPDPPLVGGGAAPPVDPPTGVDAGKLSKEPRYTVGGKSVTREDALRLVGQLADDSHKERLTVVGQDSERRALRSAIEADSGVRSRVLVQDYEPGNWAVKGHRCDGLTVYLQKPDGTTLLREDKLSPAMASSLLDRIKQRLGLTPMPPAPPPPAPVGPDGRPLPQDGYSSLALGGTGLLGTLAGLALMWWRSRQQQPQPAPAPVVVPPVAPQPQPMAPQLPPAPAPAPLPPFDPAVLLEQVFLDIWRKRASGTPLGARLEQALAMLRQVIQPQEPAKP